jgi:hypothetical protein
MTSVQELRQTLDDHAALAPDGAGLVEAAQAGAVRLRRRRRLALTGAVAALVAIAAILPATVAQVRDAPPHQTGKPPGHYREPDQLTVDLAPNTGYFTLTYGTDASRQFLVARPPDGSTERWGGDIRVYDPGTFDPTALMRGARITVQGHTAYYVSGFVVGTGDLAVRREDGKSKPQQAESRAATVGWQDESGAWVIVYEAKDKAELLRLAEVVRLGPPRDILAPYHLTYVPDDLPVSIALTSDFRPSQAYSAVSFAVDRRPLPLAFVAIGTPTERLPMTIDVKPLDLDWESITGQLGQPTVRIAGHDGWFFTGNEHGWLGPAEGSHLLLNVGRCAVTVTVADRGKITFEEQKRMIEGAQFKDCEDPDTWVKPLP